MAGRILIVEDEAAIARFVELELQHEGYAVDKAEDGRSGLELALAGTYDLILLDIMLPGLSGLEVLRRLRREKETPVILLTASGYGHGQGVRSGHGRRRLYHQALCH